MLKTQPPVLGGELAAQPAIMVDKPIDRMEEGDWVTRARVAWISSTQWFDASIRQQVRRNLANFRSIHPEDSKYRLPSFRARSNTFRPKTRAAARRVEANVAIALFATSDLVTVSAWNQANPQAVQDARIKQKLLQYRLEADENWWFLTVIGATQDAFVTGVVISYQYWKFEQTPVETMNVYRTDYADGTDSQYDVQTELEHRTVENRPCCDVIPVERFRFDPGCDWRDPVSSSPFLIYECPTYVGEIKLQARRGIADALPIDKLDNTQWWAIASNDYDSIRTMREGGRVDKYADRKAIPDNQTINVRRHVHRIDGRDWYWETLADIVMLRTPQPLTDVFPHLKEGQRPFAMGMLVPEVHKVYPSSPTQLMESMQAEINDVSNLAMDTTKMATFGRFMVRRNATVDIATLKAGVPQSVIGVDDVQRDVAELRQRDVPPSVFQQVDRLQIDLDDLTGSMTQATASANKAVNSQDQTLGAMNMLDSHAGAVRELEVRMIVKTWAEKVLQQTHDMIATYESDEDVLTDVAAMENTDVNAVLAALKARTRVRINVGFNSTSPEKRIGRLTLALGTMFKLFPDSMQNANRAEIQKELFGAVGLDDGSRFFPSADKQDPQVAALKQQVQQLTAQLQNEQYKTQAQIQIAGMNNASRERVATISAQVQYDIALLANKIETNKAYLESIDRQLAAHSAELASQELELERAALAASIHNDSLELQVKMHQAINSAKEQDSASKAKKGGSAPAQSPPPSSGREDGPPAMRTPNGDKAGTLARGDYGSVPFQAG